MRKALKKLSLASVIIALPFMASAKDFDFKSADFAFTGDQLLSAVDSKSVSADGDVLYCRADISIQGAAERTHCYGKTSAVELVVEAEQALKAMAFSPAEVEGEKVPVRMSFRVAFTPVDDITVVSLIPNLGTMQAQFGRNYVEPQERLDVSDWYERYSDNSWVGGKKFLGEGDMSRVATTIDQSGKPSRMHTVAAKRAHERDADIVKNTLKFSRFIPGTVNGRVVPMDYMVAVHYEDNNSAYATAK